MPMASLCRGHGPHNFLGLTERFWLNLQARYDLEMEKDLLADRLEREVLVYGAAREKISA